MNQHTIKDFKNLEGKVKECITPQYLSGAGKPNEVKKQIFHDNFLIKGIKGKGTSFNS